MPADPKLRVPAFYDGLKERGYVIYPGKLTVADSLPHRLHRPALSRAHARRAGGDPRCPGRDGRARRSRQQGSVRSSAHEHPAHPARFPVNGRDYRFPKTPTVVVCIDGSEPGYIERAIEAGLAPNFARLMRDRRQPAALSVDPELHQSEQHVDHHRPSAGRARHRRQLLL